MIDLALVAALVSAIGALAAIAARDRRFVALGLLVAMVSAPLASSPEPQTLVIALRILGALLAAYMLWAAAGARSISSEGSGVGAVAEVAAMAAAFVVGWFATPVRPMLGPIAAQAAGISLVALAVVPLTGRNVMRVGTAIALLVLGISLLLQAWVGPLSSLQQIVLMALLVGIVGATSLLMAPSELPAASRLWAAGAIDQAEREDRETELVGDAEPAPDDGPAGPSAQTPGAAASDAAQETAADGQAAPSPSEAAVQAAVQAVVHPPTRVRSATIRASSSKSPSAIRHSAPTRLPEDGAATDPPASPPVAPQVSARARRLRPREPRQ